MPTKPDTDDEEIQSLSDEEADREVAAICSAPIYYWVRSRHTKRCRYYTYDALDYIAEQHISKRQCYNPTHLQGYPVEH